MDIKAKRLQVKKKRKKRRILLYFKKKQGSELDREKEMLYRSDIKRQHKL